MCPTRIGFAGSVNRDRAKPWSSFAYAVGYQIGLRGHTLVSGGCSGGLTQCVAEGCRDALIEAKRKDDVGSHIISYLPGDNDFAHIDFGQLLVCKDRSRKERRPFMASQLDVLITICGSKGTKSEAKAARNQHKRLLPVGGSGGTSKKLWKDINEEGIESYYMGYLTESEFGRLGGTFDADNDDGIRKFAEYVVSLAERITEGRCVQRILRAAPRALKRWTWEESLKWQIENERHVQNFVWALLAPSFPDLKDEQYIDATGLVQPRADLIIPSQGLIIEIKVMRKGEPREVRRITEEIAADKELYFTRDSRLRRMIAFVWDSSGSVHLHANLEEGLRTIAGEAIVVSQPSKISDP